MRYDAAIIGTGPAGVSAALNLKIHEKRFVWIGSGSLSEKIGRAERISNYPGFIDADGAQLSAAFRAHVEAMGIGIAEAMVSAVYPTDDGYALAAGTDFYEARALVLATGAAMRGTLPGEQGLVGRGVSYCATCDGGLYRGRTVAVICANPRFEHEAAFLAGLAAKVYFFPTYAGAGDPGENVEMPAARVAAVLGEDRVRGVRLTDGTELAVDGLFCLRDAIALASLLPGLETRDGHIVVDRAMATNLPGVFAAGDCTGRPYQYAKAVGEGNVAAHSVINYLEEHRA